MLVTVDTTATPMRKGEQHVVFATLFRSAEPPRWSARTEACMFPEGLGSKDNALIERLNQFFKQS